MSLQIKQFFAIAAISAREMIRQPVTLLLATVCVLLVGLMPLMITHSLGASAKLIRDSAFALHLMCGLVLGCYTASSSMVREIRKGTAAAILSKPISRTVFFLAKTSGVSLIVLCFSLAMILSTMMAVRMGREAFLFDWRTGGPLLLCPTLAFLLAALFNFVTRKSFPALAFINLIALLVGVFLLAGLTNRDWFGVRHPFIEAYDWRLIPAGLLISMALLVLTALAIMLSTRLDLLPTLFICLLVFSLGLISDYAFGQHAATNPLARTLHTILPNWQHFWVVDGLADGHRIPWNYVGLTAKYAGLYLLGIISLGTFTFRNMELK
jgi:hypothetical protein